MPTSYERGKSAEYRVKGMLEERVYLVLRSAASYSPIDLFAAKGGERLVVQVKVSGRLSKEGRGELLRWAQEFGAKPNLARRSRGRWVLEVVCTSST